MHSPQKAKRIKNFGKEQEYRVFIPPVSIPLIEQELFLIPNSFERKGINEDNLKNDDYLKNEDGLKNQDYL